MINAQNPIDPAAQELDNQYRAINNVTGAWTLPALPDEVALDLLASPLVTSAQQQVEFLQGLESDLADSLRPKIELPELLTANQTPLVEGPALKVPGQFQARNSAINDVRKIYAGFAGLRPPQIVASDPNQAVYDLKIRAIEAGYLDPSTPIDGSWNPQMNSIRRDLMQEEVRDRLAGDKPGAVGAMEVLETLDKWMSPSSLVGSLLTQQIFWDPNQIANDFENWGDGIQEWMDDPFSLEKFGKALGPIDDIVMPALNMYLMFSGFRGVMVFANAARHLAGGRTIASLAAQSTRLGRAAAEVERFRAPGMIAGRLLQSPGSARQAIGRGMAGWRQFHGVAATKKVVQQAARSGFVGQLGAELSPNAQGTSLLGQTGPVKARMDDFRQYRTTNPYGMLAMAAVDLPLAPRTIFAEGAFGTLAGRAIGNQYAQAAAGGVVGAVAGAAVTDKDPYGTVIGAWAGASSAAIGGYYVKRMTSVADDEKSALTMMNAVITKFEADPTKADRLAKARQLMQTPGRQLPDGEKDGVLRAFYYLLTGNDDLLGKAKTGAVQGTKEFATGNRSMSYDPIPEAIKLQVGEQMTYVLYAAALDKTARGVAYGKSADINSKTWLDAYYEARAHFVNRMTGWDGALRDEFGNVDAAGVQKFIDDFSGRTSLDAAIDADGDYNFFAKPTSSGPGSDAYDQVHAQLSADWAADQDKFIDWAESIVFNHEEFRAATVSDVFDSLDDSDIFTYIVTQVDNFDDWQSFAASEAYMMTHLADLDVSQIELVGVGTGARGTKAWRPAEVEESMWANVTDWNTKGIYKNLNQVQASHQRANSTVMPTLMRSNHWSKQDLLRIRRRLQTLKEMQRRLAAEGADGEKGFGELKARFGQSLEDWATSRNKTVGQLTDTEISDWVASTKTGKPGQGVSGKTQKRFARTARYLSANNLDPDNALQIVNNQVRIIAESSNWNRMGHRRINPYVTDEATGGLRMRNADEMIADIDRNVPFVGAEIKVDPAIADELAKRGYKAVAGHGVMYNKDITDPIDGVLSEISRKQFRRITFGNLFSRDTNTYPIIKAQRKAQTVSALQKAVAAAVRSGQWDGPSNIPIDDPVFFENMYDQLVDARHLLLESRAEAARGRAGFWQDMKQRVANAGLPYTANDLNPQTISASLNGDPDFITGTPLYGKKAISDITAALRQGKVMPYEQDGLAAINDLLISQSWLRAGLNAMSYTDVNSMGNEIGKISKAGRLLGFGAAPVTRPGNQANLWKQYQRVGTAVLSGAIAAAATDGNILAASTGAATGAVLPQPQLSFYPRMAGRFAAGIATHNAVAAEGGDATTSVASGVAAATLGLGAVRLAVNRAMTPGKFLDKSLANYSVLGDKFVRMRDELRFSLSPFFDASRYTEGMMLAATADTPVALPVGINPMKTVMKQTGKSRRQIVEEYKLASGGQDYLDVIDSSQAWFFERGLLNFSPTEWMAASHQRLVQSGMDPIQAADKVRDVYTYGTRGRSAAEKSANFIFFPFSFQKKYLGALAKHIADDLTRQTVIHDSLKMYEILEERTEFKQYVSDHFPILRQFRRLNTLGYGLSLGQLGGINRTAIDLARATPKVGEGIDSVTNLFMPQALRIESEQDLEQVIYQVERMTPIYRDIRLMFEDAMNQGHVITSPSHLSKEAEKRRGWEEFDKLRSDLSNVARAIGAEPTALFSMQGKYAPIGTWYQRQVSDLARQYPVWNDSRLQGYKNAVERSDDIRRIVVAPTNDAEVAMARFDQIVQLVMGLTQPGGYNAVEDADLVNSQIVGALRNEAIKLVAQTPEFGRLYKMYYQNRFGPIHLNV